MAWTDDAEALGTVGAVIVSAGVTWWTTRLTKAERKRSDEALKKEHERTDQAQRVARKLATLNEIYDLYAEHVERRGLHYNSARIKVQIRLGLLPETVATTIRSITGGPMSDESRAKLQWVTARAERARAQSDAQDVPLDLLQEELAADMWFVGEVRPDCSESWWLAYEESQPAALPPFPAPAQLQRTQP